jgi:hypothetical protein
VAEAAELGAAGGGILQRGGADRRHLCYRRPTPTISATTCPPLCSRRCPLLQEGHGVRHPKSQSHTYSILDGPNINGRELGQDDFSKCQSKPTFFSKKRKKDPAILAY